MNYLNTGRQLELNSEIIEWDIKSAGLSICTEFKLIPKKELEYLKSIPKEKSNILIGIRSGNDKVFAKELESKFNEVVNEFIELNDLDKDYDILAIKRDAVFVINHPISKSQITENIRFVDKNTYHAYLYLKPLELYFKRNGEIDIKHFIGNVDERQRILKLHENGMMYLFKSFIELCESSNFDTVKISKEMSDFVKAYKNRELDFDFYREFTTESKFRYYDSMVSNINESMLEKINISYNYVTFILPLIQLII